MGPSFALQQILESRAKELLAKLLDPSGPQHGPTVGDKREEAILASLKDVIPSTYGVSSGFVTDARGIATPQIDAMFYKLGTIPPIFHTQKATILPFEIFRFGMEIKSVVTRESFDQVRARTELLSKMTCSAIFPGPPPQNKHMSGGFRKKTPPFFLVGVTSELSIEALAEETKKSDGLVSVFVFDRCVVSEGGDIYEGKSNEERVLRFWATIFHCCTDLSPYVQVSREQASLITNLIARSQGLDPADPQVMQQIIYRLSSPSLFPYIYPPTPGSPSIQFGFGDSQSPPQKKELGQTPTEKK